jgi:cytochrome c biogenesis protein CcmG/thiol:disulfide interchange protein DsbE
VAKLNLFFRTLALSLLFAVAGCDRGSHPDQIGHKAPDFVVQDGSRRIQLSQYRGKVVVLNFWASWCPPCLEEFPSLVDLQHRMPQVVVLAVSFDHDADAYRQFLTDNHIDLLTVRDGSEHSNLAFGTSRPPETYIIDRNGVIRRKFIGGQQWTSPDIVAYLNRL